MWQKLNYWISHIRDPLYRNSIILLCNTASTSVIGFVFWMVIARLYSPVDVGYGSAAISAMMLLGSLGLLGVNNTLIRFLPSFENPRDFINTSLSLTSLISLVIAIIFVIGIEIFSPALAFIRNNLIFALSFIIFTVANCGTSVLDGIFIAHRKTQYVFLTDTSISLLKIVLAVVLSFNFHSFGVAASWGLATAVMIIVAVLVFLPRVQPHYRPVPAIKTEVVKRIWQYTSSNYVASIILNLPAWILPIMIVNLLGSEQNAYFYITWMFYIVVMAIPFASANSLFAEASHNLEEFWKIVRKTFRFTYLLLIPAAILMIVLGPKILWLFGGNYSSASSELLRIMAASTMFGAVYAIYNVMLRVLNKLKELCILSAVYTSLILGLCLYFIQDYGLISIGYIWVFVQVVTGIYVGISILRLRKSKSAK